MSLDDGRLRTVLLRGSEQQWIRLVAHTWVDASNDADTAAKTGGGFYLGREQANPDHAMQAAGLFFKLKNVNWPRIRNYTHQQRAIPLREAIKEKPTILASTDARLRGKKVVLNLGGGTGPYAWERGDIVKEYVPRMPAVEVMSINFGRIGDHEVILNSLNILGVNGLSRSSRLHGREQAIRELSFLVPFLRSRMPGLEKAELAGVAPELYIRETRHISGVRQLTAENVKNATKFPDRIALCAYSMDLHPYKRKEVPSGTRRWVFTLPLSALIPLRVDGLFVASRSLSATWMAAGAARVIPVTMAAGQAAGLCAAMCAQQDLTPHKFVANASKVVELQDALRKVGVDVGDNAPLLARQARAPQR
ncbi:MAG: FAD-dependent oxidoreductase [Oxalobacteraceae bacterium]|nr:MAG: FAD-dependent oxidoreductase [Oxalobacteraceae bacterium]